LLAELVATASAVHQRFDGAWSDAEPCYGLAGTLGAAFPKPSIHESNAATAAAVAHRASTEHFRNWDRIEAVP